MVDIPNRRKARSNWAQITHGSQSPSGCLAHLAADRRSMYLRNPAETVTRPLRGAPGKSKCGRYAPVLLVWKRGCDFGQIRTHMYTGEAMRWLLRRLPPSTNSSERGNFSVLKSIDMRKYAISA